MSRQRRKQLLVVSCLVATVVALVVAAYWPHVSPTIIHFKVRLLGPELVYRTLVPYYERWDVVLAGVKTADPSWLRVAAELYPALDTHPGEEMLHAVSSVVERNPATALSLLQPIYGVGVVCGGDGIDDFLTPAVAEKRLKALQQYAQRVEATPELSACIQAAEEVMKQASRLADRSSGSLDSNNVADLPQNSRASVPMTGH